MNEVTKIVKMVYSENLFLLSKNPPETYCMPSEIARCIGFDWDLEAAVNDSDIANSKLLEKLSDLIGRN